jgi:hypothetical protein
MGFSREMALDALIECGSVTEATEYLLSAAGLRRPDAVPLTEEEQVERAIAMSLQQNIAIVDSVDDASSLKEQQLPSTSTVEPLTSSNIAPVTTDENIRDVNTAVLMNEQDVRSRTELHVVPLCLKLMQIWPNLVYRIADLLSVVIGHLDVEWTERTLVNDLLIGQTSRVAVDLLASDLTTSESLAHSLATRLHLLCLMFDVSLLSCLDVLFSGTWRKMLEYCLRL